MANFKAKRFLKRKLRVKMKVRGDASRPRLSVFRSNKNIYAQIIDDAAGKTLVSAKNREKEIAKIKSKMEAASAVGEAIAVRALKAKIKKVVFDKGGFKYHGRVKALAEGARKGGLEF
ncbi:50S ribosomal protein L18 [Candidatus Woesebacteria bacterium RBG_19FT_COMBO_47_8]|uniref:Large ribosomal subunit protein uL18 n=1 Tax=Candidatus Woesebacteria bacterium RBG_13_46_13 TaxID=1802479 RepID=A0A1F7X5B2_9BACT|nr:MAG: 50S ribosomal protein L18 [Candidatus Woesebacteria bacterium RBG_13_46_13]OGM16746.1 MAG: 50S ribosomal protein L18 [Candidatus Woesebacteria bacterium RBG_19FT_COMBO_47_8]HJX59151.1 50S ribosomal protein L18 [Patescibacteria group bacterium]